MAKKIITYEKQDSFVDYSTGEIASKRETKIVKVEKDSDKFFKLFVDNMGVLYGLQNASSFKVLFSILNGATTRENLVFLGFGMRSRLCNSLGIHLNVFARGLKELIEKGIIKKTQDKDYFVLNPYIFGQGSFIDVEKLRQSIEVEYDFKSGEIRRTISADSITSFGMHILQNPQKYEVSSIEQEQDNGDSNISISLKESSIEGKEVKSIEPPKEPTLPLIQESNESKDFTLQDSSKDQANDSKCKERLIKILKTLQDEFIDQKDLDGVKKVSKQIQEILEDM